MKIISWNVNGIRAVMKKGFSDFLKKENPDVLILQETKIDKTAVEKEKSLFDLDFFGYEQLWNPAERPGYSGTAILVSARGGSASGGKSLKVKSYKVIKVLNYFVGFGKFSAQGGLAPGGDNEGRVQTIEFDEFYLMNVYFPNANHELSRLGYKLDFNNEILKYSKKLEKKKPVIIGGDFNVAHNEIDLARPRENVGNPGFTKEERAWADKFVKAGFTDVFRALHPDKIQYSWWSYRAGARAKNIGWRIDYFFASAKIMKKIKSAYILDRIMGSDHCPVSVEIEG